MAQDLSNVYIDVYVKEALRILKSNIVMPSLITTEFDGSATVRGENIKMKLPATSTPSLNTADAVSYSDHSFSEKTITINKWIYDKKYISDRDFAMALWNPDAFIAQFIDPMATGIAEYVDKLIFNLYKDIYYFVNCGSSADPDEPDSVADLKLLRKKFSVLKIPKPWNVVMNPVAYAAAMIDEIVKASYRGNATTPDTGNIINYLGMNFFEAQNLDEATGGLHTAGAWGSSPLTDDAATATGDTDSHADQLTDGAVIKDGDLITIAGDTAGQYVVTADATASGNEADISFQPGMVLTGGWDDSVAITIEGKGVSYVNNLAFNKGAIGLAFGALGTMANMFGPRVSEIRPEAGNGEVPIPIRLTMGYDDDIPGVYIMIDLLCGLGVIRPDYAFRVLGDAS